MTHVIITSKILLLRYSVFEKIFQLKSYINSIFLKYSDNRRKLHNIVYRQLFYEHLSIFTTEIINISGNNTLIKKLQMSMVTMIHDNHRISNSSYIFYINMGTNMCLMITKTECEKRTSDACKILSMITTGIINISANIILIRTQNIVLGIRTRENHCSIDNTNKLYKNSGSPVFGFISHIKDNTSATNNKKVLTIMNKHIRMKNKSKIGSSFFFNKIGNPVQDKNNQFNEIIYFENYCLSVTNLLCLFFHLRGGFYLSKTGPSFFLNRIGSPVLDNRLSILESNSKRKKKYFLKTFRTFRMKINTIRITSCGIKHTENRIDIFSKHPNFAQRKYMRHTALVLKKINIDLIDDLIVISSYKTFRNPCISEDCRKRPSVDYIDLYFCCVVAFSCRLGGYYSSFESAVKRIHYYSILLKCVTENPDPVTSRLIYSKQGFYEKDNHIPATVSIGKLHVVFFPCLNIITLKISLEPNISRSKNECK